MQFLAGFLLLLLFPPPSASAANAEGLQECINDPTGFMQKKAKKHCSGSASISTHNADLVTQPLCR